MPILFVGFCGCGLYGGDGLEGRGMAIAGEEVEAAAAMEVEAFKRLYPLQFYERYLDGSVRPDGRPLARARPTSIALGTLQTQSSRGRESERERVK